MGEVYRKTHVRKARVEHTCEACGFKIKPGQPYYSCFEAGDPQFKSGGYALCETCEYHMAECDACTEAQINSGIEIGMCCECESWIEADKKRKQGGQDA